MNGSSEYSVGNYAYRRLGSSVIKVDRVDMGIYLLWCESCYSTKPSLRPVELTEYWLINRMGFKEVKARSGIRKAYKKKSIRIELSNSGNFYFKGRPLRGVHDVQNVYFHNEYEELAIN